MKFDLSLFKHHYTFRVRFHHVDRQDVVHSIRYFYFFDEARLEYLRAIGFPLNKNTFINENKFYVVRNICDYFGAAEFDDELDLLTRIAFVKNSSIGYEHLAIRKRDGAILVSCTHIVVYVNAQNDKPERVPDNIREMIENYEGDSVEFRS